MALFRRKASDQNGGDSTQQRAVGQGDRVGASPGLVRALFTLAGVAGAGFLIWLASLFDLESTSEFWIAMALLAAAGLVLGLSQLFGGWTKWGWPTLSVAVFVLGFLPTLIAGGWILLALQPDGGWQQSRLENWSESIGISGLVEDFAPFLPALALTIGLVLAFSFDTTGPRRSIVAGDRTLGVDDAARDRAPATDARTSDRIPGERPRESRSDAAETGARKETDIRGPDRRESR